MGDDVATMNSGSRAPHPSAGGRSRPTSAHPTSRVSRGAPAVLLLATALSDSLATMRDNLPGLLDDLDTEFLHDFRVAVRRTRSTLKLGRAVLPEVMGYRWEPAFKGLGDATTPLRDLDVYELDLPTMAGWLVSANPADLEPFAAHLRARRRAERRTLVRELKSARFSRLLRDWEQQLAGLVDTADVVGTKQLPAGKWANRRIAQLHRRVVRGGSAISADSPGVELHELRKRSKELRYALEVSEPVVASGSHKHLVADLKDLQDVLGRFQDCEVQRHALHGFAEEMMVTGTSTGAVLAIGELIAHLGGEQDQARRDFHAAFARFAGR
ncbi:MAG: CHAD domain-containing protein [Actinomycetota bacterium]